MKIDKSSNFILLWILAYMTALAPLATDMYLPSMGAVQESFQTTSANTQLSITVFFVAFAFGQLLYGPISDALGRRKPLVVGIIIYTLTSFACAAADSISLFVCLRFLQALGGCAGVVIARAIINDKFDIKQGASAMAVMMMVGSLAPMLAPSVGSLIAKYAPWQVIFVLLGVFGLMLLALMLWGLQETVPPEKQSPLNLPSVFRNYAAIVRDRDFMMLVLTFSLPLSALFAYITTASFVFQDHFHLSAQGFGILFGVNALGSTTFSMVNAKIVRSVSPYTILQYAFWAMLLFVGAMMVISLFDAGFWWFEGALFLTMGMIGFIAPNAALLAMDRFRQNSGAASAVLGMTQFAIAGLVSFLAGALHANTPGRLSVMMALCVLAGALVYRLLHRDLAGTAPRP